MSIQAQLEEHVIGWAIDLVQRAADQTVEETQGAASERTGELRDGITHTPPAYSEPYVICQIQSAASYSGYQDEGTGIYGPSGAPIVPLRPGGVLVFDWPAAGGVVFARSVQGAPGRHFWREPMPDRWSNAVQANG